ncbi:MAG: response regulator [Turneriella sp.]|nr:response regulator [Turneriella sp.]
MNKKYMRFCTRCFLFFCPMLVYSPLRGTTFINDSTTSANNYELFIAEDAAKKFSITDALAGKIDFQPIRGQTVAAGFTQSAYWVRLTYSLSARKQWVLELEWPHLEYLDFYVYDGQKQVRTRLSGYMRQPSGRDYMNRNFIFDLPETSGKEFTIFLRFECQVPLIVPIAIRSLGDTFIKNSNEKMFYGFVFGVIGIMLLFNFFLFLTLKDINYLNYVFFSLCFGGYSVAVSGYLREFLPDNPKINLYFVPAIVSSVWLSNYWFVRKFLELRQRSKPLYWTYTVGIVVSFLFLFPATFISPFHTDMLLDFHSLISGLLLLISSGYIWIRGHRAARFMFLAFTSWIIGMIFLLARNWGLLPHNFFTTHSLQLGSLLEMSLFSLALGDRINTIKAERELAQREALDSERKAVESLKQAESIKDTFLANTSHELRTPLQGIIGLTENLQTQLTEASAREGTDLILQSAHRLSHLIDDILDYSHLKEHGLKLNLADLDLGAQVEKVLRNLEFISRSKTIPIVNHIARNQIYVRADIQRLQQILYNILGNALKYTLAGAITVDARSQGDFIAVSVRDTGIGISADQIAGIFDRFGRIDDQKVGGTGLGLTITKNLVELHGGNISVESKLNHGSVFTFTLPVGAAYLESPTMPILTKQSPYLMAPPPDADRYVLVVDDDPFVLRSTAEHLRRRGFSVVTAHDGMTARRYLENPIAPMIVILDLMLPDVSGITLCRDFREKYSPKDLPILMLTARSELRDFVSSANAGANDYLTKPFKDSDLFLRIDNLLAMASLRRDLERTEAKHLRRIYEDLHDSLGGILTDISFMTASLRPEEKIDSSAIRDLQEHSAYALKTLRERLQAMADQVELEKDFFGCLNAQLLRRYALAGRTLRFNVVGEAAGYLLRHESLFLRKELSLLVQEIATNDLKYGNGEAEWTWKAEDSSLRLEIATHTEFNPAKQKTGMGTASIANRVAILGGRIQYTVSEDALKIHIELPIRPGVEDYFKPEAITG